MLKTFFFFNVKDILPTSGITFNVPSFLQRHALEQRHHPEGLGGVHPLAAEGAAARQGAGESTEEAGTSQQAAAAEDPGENRTAEG